MQIHAKSGTGNDDIGTKHQEIYSTAAADICVLTMSQSLYSCLNPCTFHVRDMRSIGTNLHKVHHVGSEPTDCYSIGGQFHSRKVVNRYQSH